MTFLAPWMLWALAALAAPILIHLWQRRRVVEVPFSTLRFLKIVAARTSRSARLENLLLLLLRCALFAALALAVARPVLSTRFTKWLGGEVSRTVVIAMDTSLSMGYLVGGESRLELAKKQAFALLDDLKHGDEVAVLAVNDRANQVIAQPTLDHALARRLITELAPGAFRSEFASGFREAPRIFSRSAERAREFYFLTDNQAAGWQGIEGVFDASWTKTALVVVRPDDSPGANASISSVKVHSPFVTPGSTVSGVLTLRNDSDLALRSTVEILLDGQRVAARPVEAGAGALVDVPFEFQAPPVGGRAARVVARLAGDNLPADDAFHFALSVYKPPRVLVVEGEQVGPNRTRSGFFLRKALEAGNPEPVKVVDPAQFEEMGLEPYTAVFLTDVAQPGDRTIVKLDTYLRGGGTLVIFPGDRSEPGDLAGMEFLPAQPLERRELPTGRLATRILEPAHPLFANAWDESTPFPALPQRKAISFRPAEKSLVLISIAGTEPFLVLGEHGAGRVLLLNASADRAWGDFPLSPAFLPLVQQIARFSSENAARQPSCIVGEPLPAGSGVPRDVELTVVGPDGSAGASPSQAVAQTIGPGDHNVLLERTTAAGFYEVRAGEQVIQLAAANPDPRESNLQPITPEALSKIARCEVITGLDNLKLWLAESRGMTPLWPALLLLALALFILESILSNLLARRRAQGDERHIRTGRLNRRRIGVSFRPETEVTP